MIIDHDLFWRILQHVYYIIYIYMLYIYIYLYHITLHYIISYYIKFYQIKFYHIILYYILTYVWLQLYIYNAFTYLDANLVSTWTWKTYASSLPLGGSDAGHRRGWPFGPRGWCERIAVNSKDNVGSIFEKACMYTHATCKDIYLYTHICSSIYIYMYILYTYIRIYIYIYIRIYIYI